MGIAWIYNNTDWEKLKEALDVVNVLEKSLQNGAHDREQGAKEEEEAMKNHEKNTDDYKQEFETRIRINIVKECK
eukprot:16261399-Heterocapsa_arctica.AAC.1